MRAIAWFMAGAGRAAVAALALLLAAPAAWGEERFEIRNAFAEPVGGVWQLHAILEMGLTDDAREALEEGIPLTLVLEVEIVAERRFLPDAEVAQLTQRWRLAYDALSDRYVVTNLNSRAQATYPALEEALEGLAHVRGLPLVDATLLREGRRHDISLRAAVEIGGMPDAVKFLIFWRDWTRTTDWYTWSVRP